MVITTVGNEVRGAHNWKIDYVKWDFIVLMNIQQILILFWIIHADEDAFISIIFDLWIEPGTISLTVLIDEK